MNKGTHETHENMKIALAKHFLINVSLRIGALINRRPYLPFFPLEYIFGLLLIYSRVIFFAKIANSFSLSHLPLISGVSKSIKRKSCTATISGKSLNLILHVSP